MTLGSVPLSDANRETLRAYVSRAWPEHARAQGLREPCAGSVSNAVPGLLSGGYFATKPDRDAYDRALESLARALEDLGYAIDRSRGPARYVTGWRTVDGIRVVDMDYGTDGKREADDERLFKERTVRDRPDLEAMSDPRGPKYQHAMRVDRRAAGGR